VDKIVGDHLVKSEWRSMSRFDERKLMIAQAGSQSLESRVRCATKHIDAMDIGPVAHSKWAMCLWSVAVGEVPDGEIAAPKRSGEVRDRPPIRQAWQSDSKVSSNELGFDLRESSPLPHNILSRVGLAANPDVGQPVGCS
jgi:hypothetical protein